MTLYNPVSADGFTPLQNREDRFVAGVWQVEETSFRPAFGMAALQEKSHSECHDDNGAKGEDKLAADLLAQKTADAYAQGYLNGQQAIAARFDEEQERHDALAQAIDQLKPADEVKLAKLLQKTVLSLFRQAVGHAEIDGSWLQKRCEAALESIVEEMGEASLFVAPGDAILLREYDCNVPVVEDPELLPGSVRLDYPSGQITSGSLSIAQEFERRIGANGVSGGVLC